MILSSQVESYKCRVASSIERPEESLSLNCVVKCLTKLSRVVALQTCQKASNSDPIFAVLSFRPSGTLFLVWHYT
jgi:hypothetical protein